MSKNAKIVIIIFISIAIVGAYFFIPNKQYSSHSVRADLIGDDYQDTSEVNKALALSSSEIKIVEEPEEKKPEFIVTHIETPSQVKAIYMSSWVAGTPSFRNKLVKLIEETELNSVIIDIKDYTGKVSFEINKPPFSTVGSTENRIPDIREFIGMLHEKGIYVIGRISVFQDPHLIEIWPEEAVKKSSDTSVLWRDHKGIGWLDAGSTRVWEYVADLARESHAVGFDEINFDYIRFPSDGNMKDIYYPHSEDKVKSDVIRSFFEFINKEFSSGDKKIVTSADLFGMTATNTDDLNIGQILEDGLNNFDFVAPMVYPSHFPNNWGGLPNPAEEPYEVIYRSMSKAVERAKALGVDEKKLRPWLQDFNLGAIYTEDLVRAQIQATYDVGLDSWMLWDPKNIYTRSALEAVNPSI